MPDSLLLTPPKPISLLRSFLRTEASGGILLMAAAALAIAIANSPAALAYDQALHSYLGPLTVIHWINDGLMAVFFFVIGLGMVIGASINVSTAKSTAG